ncbi:MAG: hypothetical protein ACSW8K_00575 [bacterium]
MRNVSTSVFDFSQAESFYEISDLQKRFECFTEIFFHSALSEFHPPPGRHITFLRGSPLPFPQTGIKKPPHQMVQRYDASAAPAALPSFE